MTYGKQGIAYKIQEELNKVMEKTNLIAMGTHLSRKLDELEEQGLITKWIWHSNLNFQIFTADNVDGFFLNYNDSESPHVDPED